MKTTTTLAYAIFNLLIACNIWLSASECPAMHKNNSSDQEAMKERFESWLKRHGRQYKDSEEWEVRFSLYQANLQFIECFNSRNNS